MDYKETAPQAHLVSHLKSCSDGSAVSGQPDRLATWWRGFESGRWWKKMFEKNYISVETSSRCHFWPRFRFRFRIGASFGWISKVSENQRNRKSKLFDAKQSFVKTEQLSESDAARKQIVWRQNLKRPEKPKHWFVFPETRLSLLKKMAVVTNWRLW